MFKEKLLKASKAPDFNEVYILPSLSPVDPSAVDISTKLTLKITLKIPIVSSPMDTVTELDMAVAMALMGGIGIIHRNIEREKQLEIVKKVKEHPPVRLRSLYVDVNEPCGRVLESLRKLGLRNIPVVSNNIPLGYVSIESLKQCIEFDPIQRILRPGTFYRTNEIKEATNILLKGGYDSVVIVDRNGSYLGTLVYTDLLDELAPVTDPDGRLLVGAAISPLDINRAKLLDKYVDVLVSDVANFHNKEILRNARKLVDEVSTEFIAGNIGSSEAIEDTISTVEKVSGFRVGIGGGSICLTPEITGAYAPTLWTVAIIRDTLEELKINVPIIADGGIRNAGDIVKVLSVGASSVMLGYLLAGTDEASSPMIAINERYYKLYRGMASKSAMEKRFAIDRYAKVSKRVPEGIEGLVPYKGSVHNVVRDLVEAVKAGLGYAGARNINELWNTSRFVIAQRSKNNALRSLNESHF